jgi:hypothetical protein
LGHGTSIGAGSAASAGGGRSAGSAVVAAPDIASMSCISGVKNEIAEEMKMTENNIPLFGIETPHEVDLSKVMAHPGPQSNIQI